MSADFLDIEDAEGILLDFSMNVHNTLFITLTDNSAHGYMKEKDITTFILTPDDKGIEAANKIINSLRDWLDHIKDI